MKKFCWTIFLLLIILSQPVLAKPIAVEALSDFTTENPPKEMSIKLLEDIAVDDTLTIKAETIVDGNVVDVTDPKRLKRRCIIAVRFALVEVPTAESIAVTQVPILEPKIINTAVSNFKAPASATKIPVTAAEL